MPTMTVAGVGVEVDAEGFLLDPSKWNEELARAIAAEEGIAELSERHWVVVRYMREEFARNGTGPSIRKMKNAGGIPVKELYELFPGGPAKKAARIAGIPKPHGCV
jgi:dissimilatory sulfite reductase related protein